jgi:hypothetical protein
MLLLDFLLDMFAVSCCAVVLSLPLFPLQDTLPEVVVRPLGQLKTAQVWSWPKAPHGACRPRWGRPHRPHQLLVGLDIVFVLAAGKGILS